jgi:hypothetical protein
MAKYPLGGRREPGKHLRKEIGRHLKTTLSAIVGQTPSSSINILSKIQFCLDSVQDEEESLDCLAYYNS